MFGVDAVIHGKTLLPYIMEVNNDPGMNAFFGLVKDKAYNDLKFIMYRTVYSDMIRAVGYSPYPTPRFHGPLVDPNMEPGVRHEAIEAEWLRISDLTDFQRIFPAAGVCQDEKFRHYITAEECKERYGDA
jgi:hypothetical protein